VQTDHYQWVMETLAAGENVRQPEWSYRTAVGSEAFVQEVLRQLKGQGRGTAEDG